MNENIDNGESRWEDEIDEIQPWLERHPGISAMIAPVVYLLLLAIFFLLRKDELTLIFNLSYGYYIVAFVLLTVFVCWLIEKPFTLIMKGNGFYEGTFFMLVFKYMYAIVIFFFFGFALFTKEVEEHINKQEVSEQYTVCTEIENTYGRRSILLHSITFDIESEPIHQNIDFDTYLYCEKGDAIIVHYRRGCLGKIIIEDFEIIKDLSLYELKCLQDAKGRIPTPEELQQAREEKKRAQEEGREVYFEPSDTEAEKEPEQPSPNSTVLGLLINNMPDISKSINGWTSVTFKVRKDSTIINVRTTESLTAKADKALRDAVTGMGQWKGESHETEHDTKVIISIAYEYGTPTCIMIKMTVTEADGSKKVYDYDYRLKLLKY